MANNYLKLGSQDDYVKQVQISLNRMGYGLDEDGIYGPKTEAAIRDYQGKQGLDVDGIVGPETWSVLGIGGNPFYTEPTTTTKPSGGTTTGGATESPTFTPAPTNPTLTNTNWLDTTAGQTANQSRVDAEAALDAHGKWNPDNYENADWMNQVLEDIKNRKEFSYDFNADALYQQYKDKYIQQGKMAMQDTMGQAAAMTGGYGNSYAQSVGQQAYNAQLQNLNDVIPELYQMALDKHQMETQDLYNQYGLLLEDYARAYGEHSDEYNKLLQALNRADSNFYNDANMHYTEQSNANSVAQQNWQNEFNVWDANNTNAWKETEFNEAVRQYNERMAFQQKRYEDSQKTAVSDNATGGRGISPQGSYYDNGSLTYGQIKELQKVLGVEADGYFGSDSQKAAGGLSAEEAYKKYVGGGVDEPTAEDYADWGYGEWQGYFAQIRQSEGQSAAEEELNYFISQGLIPTNFITAGASGARGGKLGH